MADSFTRLARDRLQQLTATLALLRERVREAVASEMGKAVGEALRDLLTVVLTRKTAERRVVEEPPPHPDRYAHDRWDDDEDRRWDEEQAVAARPSAPVERSPPPTPTAAAAVGLAVTLTRWLLKRRAPLWAGLGVGLAAGLATLSGHPVICAALAAVATAAELAALTDVATSTT